MSSTTLKAAARQSRAAFARRLEPDTISITDIASDDHHADPSITQPTSLVDPASRTAAGIGIKVCAASERRGYERYPTRFSATIHAYALMQAVTVRNLSRSGAMLEHAFGLAVGTEGTLLSLDGTGYPIRVVWSVSPYIGVVFQNDLAPGDPLLRKALARAGRSSRD
ncbi:MAG: PilZ domain-containing protein [Pseudomonadota bacterium]